MKQARIREEKYKNGVVIMTDSAAGNIIFVILCFGLVFMLLFLFTFIKMKNFEKRINKLENARKSPEESHVIEEVTE